MSPTANEIINRHINRDSAQALMNDLIAAGYLDGPDTIIAMNLASRHIGLQVRLPDETIGELRQVYVIGDFVIVNVTRPQKPTEEHAESVPGGWMTEHELFQNDKVTVILTP